MRTNCKTTHFRLFLFLNCVIFQAHCVNFKIKKEQIATTLISYYFCIYVNGVIFHVHCVNFEIKKVRIMFVFKWYFFQKLCVDFEGKINKVTSATIIFETIWNKEF
jgi:hypothetical protein